MKVAGRVILTLSVNSNTGRDTFNLCLDEFGKIGDSEEELVDPVQKREAIVSNLFILYHDHDLIEECSHQQDIPYPIIAVAAIPIFYSDI